MMKNFSLDKPIAFFDIESTGTNTETDRIVELSILKLFPDGTTEIKTRRINPETPIHLKATEVHGITNEMVKDEPTFKQLAQSIKDLLEDCHLAGYNCLQFDIPLLAAEFKRVGVEHDLFERKIIDGMMLFKRILPHTLTSAYKYFLDKDLEDAHSAQADIEATAEVIIHQIDNYPDVVGTTLDEVCAASRYDGTVDLAGKIGIDDDGDYIYNIGKDKGKKIKDEPGFAQWMLTKDFPEETVIHLKRILKEVS